MSEPLRAEAASLLEEIRAGRYTAARQGTQLVGAKLDGAALTGASLDYVNLAHADLTGATLAGGIYRFVDFAGATLKGADLSGAHLRFCNLYRADLTGAQLKGAQLEGCNANRAVFAEADLHKAKLRHCTLMEADLRDADLTWGSLVRCDAEGAIFDDALLAHVDTQKTIFKKASFAGARRFVRSREIITELLGREIQGDAERAKYVGALMLLEHWCFEEWDLYMQEQPPELREAALEALARYPEGGVALAFSKGLRRLELIEDAPAGCSLAEAAEAAQD